MRACAIIVVAGMTQLAFAGFTGLTVSRQIESGALIADAQTSQDSQEKQNFSGGAWGDNVRSLLVRDSMTADSQSSQSSHIGAMGMDGTSHLLQFARSLDSAAARSTGSSEFLVHFNIHNEIKFSYSYQFSINLWSSDTRQAHAQILLMRLDDSAIFLSDQITTGNISRGGMLTLQPARYAFLVDAAMYINTQGSEGHDGSVLASFNLRMVPAPGVPSVAGLMLLAARRRRA